LTSNGDLGKEFGELAEELEKRLKDLVEDPSPENVHEVRTLLRRIGAVRRLLPRGIRRKKKVARYLESTESLFRATTPVSDLDVTASLLGRMGPSGGTGLSSAVSAIGSRRSARLSEVLASGRSLQGRSLPRRPVKVSRPRLAKNRRKAVGRLDARLRDLRPRIAADPKALHSFRKDCKTLRYVLEIGGPSKGAKERIERLKQWQGALGEITDIDAALRYVSSLRPSGRLAGVRDALAAQRRERVGSLSSMPAA